MKRLSFASGLILMLIGAILLANFTASNPTNRRYASETIDQHITAQDGAYLAEDILSVDLGVSHNEKTDNTRCICQQGLSETDVNAKCNVCYISTSVTLNGQNKSAIPDFFTDMYIADSKFYRASELKYDGQMQAFVDASLNLQIPLYIYVTMNTDVHPDVVNAVRSTGGDIIPYFIDEGYIDIMDIVGVFLVALGGMVVIATGVVVARNVAKSWEMPDPEDAPKNDEIIVPRDMPEERIRKMMNDAEAFKNKVTDKTEAKIDIDDAKTASPFKAPNKKSKPNKNSRSNGKVRIEIDDDGDDDEE